MAEIKYPFLDLKPVNAPFEDELKKAACDVISSGRYINGERVSELEEKIASLCHAQHAVAVSNGLDALKLIIRAYKEMGVFNDGDEIIMAANTYIATALAVSDTGLKPVFADISATTLNLNTSILEQYITRRTAAIMPVHLYGTPCWDNALIDIAQKHNLKLIEDNAQALGAKTSVAGLHGTFHTGGLGDAAGTSFYPTKNLGALGDAGIITTSDNELANTIRALANYGADMRYHNIYKGYNCRMDELQAAMLLVKLPNLQKENERRQALVNLYNTHINNPAVVTPTEFADMSQVWHQYPLRVADRERFCQHMQRNGVATDVIYPTTVYNQPCYSHEYADTVCAEAEKFAKEVICLPIGAHISTEAGLEISKIVNAFK